jgi:CBS domain-containing protein
MNIGDVCTREVFAVGEQEPLANAVRGMESRHVGAAVIIADRASTKVPVGIVTDRDVLRGQFDRKADLHCLIVADVMTTRPLVLRADCDVAAAIDQMSSRVVRRAPVVDTTGNLVGIVSLDDLLPLVAGEIAELARTIGGQSRRERAAR